MQYTDKWNVMHQMPYIHNNFYGRMLWNLYSQQYSELNECFEQDQTEWNKKSRAEKIKSNYICLKFIKHSTKKYARMKKIDKFWIELGKKQDMN